MEDDQASLAVTMATPSASNPPDPPDPGLPTLHPVTTMELEDDPSTASPTASSNEDPAAQSEMVDAVHTSAEATSETHAPHWMESSKPTGETQHRWGGHWICIGIRGRTTHDKDGTLAGLIPDLVV
ncbi:hypothetical protein K2173_013195 [Erythroxylum novogranatense]|uniref:Uncharacterized protein n=1 Tax=Erythroxylum novogranatense TaxID=1862640 RepID=A0AAV8TF63_9ROSI|nr:hypothetical protein K2173_013195 [Erythroxylum novogranatense]